MPKQKGASIMFECSKHGLTEWSTRPGANGPRRKRCRRCQSEAVTKRRQRMKAQLVEEFGGGCVLCGYSRSVAALVFHHLDPKEKDFSISGNTPSYEKLRAEASKCVLLCANCHYEVHDGMHDDAPILGKLNGRAAAC